MWKIIIYALIQSSLLAGGQVFLKLALTRMPPFAWTREFWGSVLTNWQFAVCGLLFGSSGLLWMWIVRHYPLSLAYPMVSLTYVMGMVAAIAVFHEQVSAVKWVGVALIVLGCILITK